MENRKLASIKIWNNKMYLPAVLSFIDSIATNHSEMDTEIYNQMRFVIAYVLKKRIENSYPGGKGQLDVEIFIKDNFFEFSIKDKGVPGWYDFSYDKKCLAENSRYFDNYVLDLWTDEVGIEKLGKDGQRYYIRKRFKNPINFKAPEPYPETEALDTNITIRPVETEADAIEAIRCIYSEYGYSYAYERLYYVNSFLNMIKNKELMSFLAVNDHGQTAGHVALAFSDFYKNMPEISTAVTRKEFRGIGLFSKLIDHCLKVAKEHNCRAVMGQPVAFHPISQKAFLRENFTATSMLLSYLNPQLESEYNKDNERLDLFASVKILDKNAKSIIYPPKEMVPFIKKVYGKLGLGYEICENSFPHKVTRLAIEENSILNIKKILLTQGAEDLKEILEQSIKDTLKKKNDMIELVIPLNSESCDYCYQTAKQYGFVLSGIIPGSENGDFIIMQMFIGSDVHYDHLVTVGDFEELKNDIIALNGKD